MYDSQNIAIALSRIQNEDIKNNENRTGFYRAVVVSNNDPWNLARVRIRVPAFHGVNPESTYYISDDKLPYAYPASLNGAGYKSGQYIIPVVGSLVWVSFETGTENFVYFGGVYTAEPTGNRYIYFDRNTNNGEAIQIVEDDIPTTYNPNQYVIYQSPKGSSIIIEDRDIGEGIKLTDTNGNLISMDRNGVSVISDFPLRADFPYMITYYISISNVPETPVFTIPKSMIFEDSKFKTQASPIKGCKIAYISEGKCVGSGFVLNIDNTNITIGTNNLPSSNGEGTSDYLSLINKPSINMVTLQGNRELPETPLTNMQIEELLKD